MYRMLVALILLTLTISGCSNKPKELTLLDRSENTHTDLSDNVIGLVGPEISLKDNLVVKIIGYEIGEKGEVGYGFRREGATPISSFAEGFALGMAKALLETREDKKRDAHLAIYFEVKLSDEINTPRDSVKPNFEFKVLDHEGEKGTRYTENVSKDYLALDEVRLGSHIFNVFSDSKYFEITLSKTSFLLGIDEKATQAYIESLSVPVPEIGKKSNWEQIIAYIILFALFFLTYLIIRSVAKSNQKGGSNDELLSHVDSPEQAHSVSNQPRTSYSEYRREGFVVRDYRARGDNPTEGEESS